MPQSLNPKLNLKPVRADKPETPSLTKQLHQLTVPQEAGSSQSRETGKVRVRKLGKEAVRVLRLAEEVLMAEIWRVD